MHRAIMASDIMQFFKNNETMRKLHRDGSFNWDNQTHKLVRELDDSATTMSLSLVALVATSPPPPPPLPPGYFGCEVVVAHH